MFVGLIFMLIQRLLCCFVSRMKYLSVLSLLLLMLVLLVKLLKILFCYVFLNYGFDDVLVNFLNCQLGLFMQVGELNRMVFVVVSVVQVFLEILFLVLIVMRFVLVFLVIVFVMWVVCLQLEWQMMVVFVWVVVLVMVVFYCECGLLWMIWEVILLSCDGVINDVDLNVLFFVG